MIDILILSNGPGEVTTWVRPVVAALVDRLGLDQIRISVVISPCSNAGGREAEIALAYPGVTRSQAAQHFWPFLLRGQTLDHWDWHPQGIVIFLGGDQFFPVLIGRRLGYATLIYGEWEARWLKWVDRFAVMNDRVLAKVPAKYHPKVQVVGDLMLEAGAEQRQSEVRAQGPRRIGLLPGSKAMKLQMGLPFCLATAEYLKQARPDLEFFLPVAPSITVEYLAQFADPAQNGRAIEIIKGCGATLESDDGLYLKTSNGLRIDLHTTFPAYDQLTASTLCLTTLGANTAELASLGVPMIVLTVLYELDVSWDGLPGLLTKIPGVGRLLSRGINWYFYHRDPHRKFAWPNIWAGREIVPELAGWISPEFVGQRVLDYLDHPEKLEQMREDLATVRGPLGAAEQMGAIVQEMIAQLQLNKTS
jgi:hypothetical protein